DRQRALGVAQTRYVAGIALDIRADVAPPGGGDVAADAVAFHLGEQFDVQRIRRQALADDHFQLVGLAIEQADGEVIEVHQLLREADDLLLQQLEPLPDVHLAERIGLKADQFAARLVDSINLLLESPRSRRVPYDRDHLHDL